MTLWANLHGSFVIALGLPPLFVAETPVPRRRLGAWRDPLVRRWLAFTLGSLVACLANPNGIDLSLRIGAFLLDDSLATGNVWRAWNFLGFTLFAHRTQRQPYRPFVAPPVLATPLGQWAPRTLNSLDRLALKGRPDQRSLAFASAAALIVLTGGLHTLYRPLAPSSHEWAQAALDAVQKAYLEGPAFNHDYASGALARHGIKVYIDAQSDLYGAQFTENDAKLISIADSDTAMQFIRKCSARGTLLQPAMPLVAYLDLAPGLASSV